ncbi:glycosyltransferase family 4 protein [Salinarimonas ramus]|uniref:Glycosyl transferase n=1 Tax=Salinarimonas ramus TaxID=690164 RepID=A0A917Q5Q3_9HYPH|nr:glycosyltransferase family 4 protein [Salinarimonas ramus]GGK19018.1 glycosyl transferase [Salinarimonas ramus]
MNKNPHLRILHVFRAPLGGLFRHVLDLTRAQLARGYDVGIFCDSTTGNAVTEAALAELAPRLPLGLHRVPIARNPGFGDLSALRALAKVRRATDANILHAHGAKGGAFARLVPLPSGSRVARLYTPHGGSFNYRPGSMTHRAYMAVEGLLAHRTEIFTFESAFIAGRFETYVGGSQEKIRVIYNGISDTEFEPVCTAKATFDLLYIGELRAAKGIDTLLDALARLRNQGRTLTLLAVGSGPDREQLAARVATLGLDGSVVFEDPRPIREALGRARVMVVPSRAESLPYVVLEAAAACQPLVSTDVGGIPEIFGPFHETLIPPDDADRLAEAIAAKLDEGEESRRASALALTEHVRARFALDKMADGVLSAYVDALGLGASAPFANAEVRPA